MNLFRLSRYPKFILEQILANKSSLICFKCDVFQGKMKNLHKLFYQLNIVITNVLSPVSSLYKI